MAQTVKNLLAMKETRVPSLAEEDPLGRGRVPSPIFLPRESRRQRGPMGYSPWGRKESDTTERLTLSQSCSRLLPMR